MDRTGTSLSPSRLALALAERARLTPDRAAAWDIERSLTYAELEDRASALAHRIHERRDGLGPGGVLPILVAHDLASLVAIHAAIRAGVTFAPLDHRLPAAAIASILHRLDDPRVVLAAGPVDLPAGIHVIDRLLAGAGSLDPVGVDPDAAARIIFTSGSTGEPKGVVSSWRSIDGALDDPVMAPPPDVEDPRAAVLAPMSFAAGVLSAMRPALGTAVTVLDPNAHDPVDLLERMDADRLTTIAVVPSHVAAVLDRWPSGRRMEAVRSIMTFGEALEWSMVPVMRRLIPETAVVVNVYGASEGGITFALVISSSAPLGTGRVPLGRPVSPDLVRLEPVGPDADDLLEVVSRGTRVALGYWREPELTARVFGHEEDGTPFWRSGDLVRLDAEGLAHFVGRRDNVVKINGKLVEPSEPERVLGEIDGIRRAVVLVQDAPRGGQRLVAHLEVDAAAQLDPADVRNAVAEQVAPHLVPAVIVRHDALPLTSRGKIDRQALVREDPVPWHRPASTRQANLNEAAVLAVASEVLGFDAIGPDDDLWDLGLDSLGATELLATLTDFGWATLPEAALLEHRTAAAIAALRGESIPTGAPIWLNASEDAAPVVCVLGPSSDALTYRRLSQELAPDLPVGIVRQFDPASTRTPLRTVPEIAGEVRRAVQAGRQVPPAVVVGYSGSGVVAYELARQYAADGVRVPVVLLDAPAGASTARRLRGAGAAGAAMGRRLRRGARRAFVRALPAALPQRERAFALFDLASEAAMTYPMPPTDVPVTLIRALDRPLPGLVEDWSAATAGLTVVDVACDHDAILATPHIGVVADHVRELAVRA